MCVFQPISRRGDTEKARHENAGPENVAQTPTEWKI